MMGRDKRVEIAFGERPLTSRSRRGEDVPFCIVVLGDLSGGSNRGLSGAAGREPPLIDRDNFDRVLSQFSPAVTLEWGDGQSMPVHLRFAGMDDFLPDSLLQQIDSLFGAEEAHISRSDARTSASRPEAAETAESDSPSAPKVEDLVGEDLLGLALEATEERKRADADQARPRRDDRFAEYVQQLVKPFVRKEADAEQKIAPSERSTALAAELRKILHHPQFQALEALWRSVFFLTQRLETGTMLKVLLLDVAKSALHEDLQASEKVEKSSLYRALVDRPSSERPWSFILGDYLFEPSETDLLLLKGLGRISQSCGAPFVAAGSPQLLGCRSLVDTPHPGDWSAPMHPQFIRNWESLRESEVARFLGLTVPRFLLRSPYGQDATPVESLPFEEMIGIPRHEDYLWGNGAFLCGCLVGQAFSRMGWQLRPGAVREIGNLPTHVYSDGLEWRSKPCAEVNLTQSAAEKIAHCGLMALRSAKGGDSIALASFRSLAESPAALEGPWERQN